MNIINAADAAAISARKGMDPRFVLALKEVFRSILFNSERGLYSSTLTVETSFYSDVLRVLETLEYRVTVPNSIPKGAVQAVIQVSWDHKKNVYLWEVIKEALSDDQKPAT